MMHRPHTTARNATMSAPILRSHNTHYPTLNTCAPASLNTTDDTCTCVHIRCLNIHIQNLKRTMPKPNCSSIKTRQSGGDNVDSAICDAMQFSATKQTEYFAPNKEWFHGLSSALVSPCVVACACSAHSRNALSIQCEPSPQDSPWSSVYWNSSSSSRVRCGGDVLQPTVSTKQCPGSISHCRSIRINVVLCRAQCARLRRCSTEL